MIRTMRRITGIALRTKDPGLTRRLFELGEQGRALSLTLAHLAGIERFLGLRSGAIRPYLLELLEEEPFLRHLNVTIQQAREALSRARPLATEGTFDYGPLLYALVRWTRARLVVETGVASGISSAYVLKAMAVEGQGVLYSIDAPGDGSDDPKYVAVHLRRFGAFRPTLLPPGCETGYAVPEGLRSRWQLILGDATIELPSLLERLGMIDLFLHDSKHSYDHMRFEYQTVYPHLRPAGGLLLSDNVSWNPAFAEFASEVRRPARRRPIGILVT